MPPTTSTVSFTVRRPTPVSRPSSSGPESDGPFKIPALPRHLASAGSSAGGSPLTGSPRPFSSREGSDNDDDDGETGIVFANGVGGDDHVHTESSDEEQFAGPSGQRSAMKRKKVDDEPLVIPAKSNPDWREAARRRRAACGRLQSYMSRAKPSFVPGSALATTGADGSVGGLGTRDTINSGPQLSGLQTKKKVAAGADEDGTTTIEQAPMAVAQPTPEPAEETDDQRALRAILAGEDDTAHVVDIIPVPPLSEADALKQDVEALPDVATADGYERVPIAAFGAAMLRGMGWTDGAAAAKADKRRKNGLTELYLPQARPALLGIGAKEREPEDDGGKKKKKGAEMRYVPVARKESGSRSGTVSRRGSRSPSRREREDRVTDRERGGYDDRERRRERERDRDRDDDSRRRTKDYDERAREQRDYGDRDRDRDKERDRDRGRGDPHRDREREGRGKQYDQRDRSRNRRDGR